MPPDDASWEKFRERVKRDVTPPAARPRPSTAKPERSEPKEERPARTDGRSKPDSRSNRRPERPKGEREERPREREERPREREERPRQREERPREREEERPRKRREEPREEETPEEKAARRAKRERQKAREAAAAAAAAERNGEASEGDGKGDTSVKEELKKSARVVPLDKLRKGGTQYVRVIDPSTIIKIVGDSVHRALEAHTHRLTSEERAAIEQQARAGFSELMAEHKKLQGEKADLEAEKSAVERRREALEKQVADMRADLEIQQRRLAEEKQREVATQEGVQLSAQALDEMERRGHALIKRMLAGGELGPIGTGAPTDGVALLARELDGVVEHVIALQRRQHATTSSEGEVQTQNDAVELLERRIEKLTRALEETERQLTPFELHRPVSAFQEVQGISEDDPGYKWRSDLLRMVFLENLALRGMKATEADRTGPFPGKRLMASMAREAAERASARSTAGW